MSTPLPPAIERYFAAADRGDAEATAATFTEDGAVHDEGHHHHGRADIAAWIAAAQQRYRFSTGVLRHSADGDTVTVVARVSGDFPGSPADLTYRFELRGDAVAGLEISA